MAADYLTVDFMPAEGYLKFFSRIALDPAVSWGGSMCWNWTGCLVNGYGQFYWSGTKGNESAHRLAFAWLVHPLPRNQKLGELDHLCRNTKCCNPAHLEFVSTKTNALRSTSPPALNARKTLCVNGHPLSGENLIIRANGTGRACRECCRSRLRQYYRTPKGQLAYERHKSAKRERDRSESYKAKSRLRGERRKQRRHAAKAESHIQ